MARKVIKSVSLGSNARDDLNSMFEELYDGSALPAIVGVTASAAEINYNDITTLGTGAASKAVVLDAGEDYTWPATGVLKYGVLKDPAGTAITATATEINYLDITTVGTGAELKAVVPDAGGDYTWPTNGVFKYFQLKDADDTLMTATMEYVNQQCDYTTQVMTVGAGFSGAGTIYKVGVRNTGTMKKTEIMIDLTDTKSVAVDLDIIGVSGVSHIGQITAALNGTILMGKVTCLEVPVGGAVDIDLYAATEGTGAYDAGIAALDETALVTAGGNWTLGLEKIMTGLPAANQYLYLTSGAATAGTYTAGKFLIEFWGY